MSYHPGRAASRQARDHHTQALAIARDLGAPLEEARALEGIGHCHLQDGHASEGTAHLQQALAIYQRINQPSTLFADSRLRRRGDPAQARREKRSEGPVMSVYGQLKKAHQDELLRAAARHDQPPRLRGHALHGRTTRSPRRRGDYRHALPAPALLLTITTHMGRTL